MQGLAWGVGLVHLFGILVLQAYIRVHSDLVRTSARRSIVPDSATSRLPYLGPQPDDALSRAVGPLCREAETVRSQQTCSNFHLTAGHLANRQCPAMLAPHAKPVNLGRTHNNVYNMAAQH